MAVKLSTTTERSGEDGASTAPSAIRFPPPRGISGLPVALLMAIVIWSWVKLCSCEQSEMYGERVIVAPGLKTNAKPFSGG